ncbi:hypothetical protein E3U99_19410 [Salmonella enterica]|nr:hypothetical protein [Salmonella enterica]EDX1625844.1 hypothetical protein [Salmonella enterica subsp. enterica serovar Miami]EAO4449827.1 hypothetical protein [Salmonella enterica]EAT6331018.1 hypothetical protein [Salmonella enterica]EAT7526339.1 hypothetical protein [Salmonella enterica]
MKSNSKWLRIAICCIFTALLPPSARADDDCQITFSSPNVSFGWLKQDDIVNSQQGWNQMSSQEIHVSVSCPKSQNIALFVQASAGEKGRFYFGNNGGLVVRVSQMIVDGKSYPVASTLDRVSFAPNDSALDSLLLHNNNGIIAMDNNQQVSGKMMNVTLTLTSVLNDNQFTHSTDTVMLESNLQWEVLTK